MSEPSTPSQPSAFSKLFNKLRTPTSSSPSRSTPLKSGLSYSTPHLLSHPSRSTSSLSNHSTIDSPASGNSSFDLEIPRFETGNWLSDLRVGAGAGAAKGAPAGGKGQSPHSTALPPSAASSMASLNTVGTETEDEDGEGGTVLHSSHHAARSASSNNTKNGKLASLGRAAGASTTSLATTLSVDPGDGGGERGRKPSFLSKSSGGLGGSGDGGGGSLGKSFSRGWNRSKEMLTRSSGATNGAATDDKENAPSSLDHAPTSTGAGLKARRVPRPAPAATNDALELDLGDVDSGRDAASEGGETTPGSLSQPSSTSPPIRSFPFHGSSQSSSHELLGASASSGGLQSSSVMMAEKEREEEGMMGMGRRTISTSSLSNRGGSESGGSGERIVGGLKRKASINVLSNASSSIGIGRPSIDSRRPSMEQSNGASTRPVLGQPRRPSMDQSNARPSLEQSVSRMSLDQGGPTSSSEKERSYGVESRRAAVVHETRAMLSERDREGIVRRESSERGGGGGEMMMRPYASSSRRGSGGSPPATEVQDERSSSRTDVRPGSRTAYSRQPSPEVVRETDENDYGAPTMTASTVMGGSSASASILPTQSQDPDHHVAQGREWINGAGGNENLPFPQMNGNGPQPHPQAGPTPTTRRPLAPVSTASSSVSRQAPSYPQSQPQSQPSSTRRPLGETYRATNVPPLGVGAQQAGYPKDRVGAQGYGQQEYQMPLRDRSPGLGAESTPSMTHQQHHYTGVGYQQQQQQQMMHQGQQHYPQAPMPPPDQPLPPKPVKKMPTPIRVNGKEYHKAGVLGRGGSSRVYRVLDSSHNMYAIKRVDISRNDSETRASFLNEITLLKKLAGKPQIIRLIDSEISENKRTLYMVLEPGEADLAHLLQEHMGKEVSMTFIRYIWEQMLEAVQVIHDENVVHTDLKPANFVLVKGRLKLIDFGISKAIGNDTTNIKRDQTIGTANYMPPEALMDSGMGIDGRKMMKLGRPADVWSLGCILHQMVYGRAPFAHIRDTTAKILQIQNPNYKINFARTTVPYDARGEPMEELAVPVGPVVIATMTSCLRFQSKDRQTIPELLKGPFLSADGLTVNEQIMPKVVERLFAMAKVSGMGLEDFQRLSDDILRELRDLQS
ncbi:serine/threonine-protein kinase TTK/MPS1 [Pseudohyphozyma bogoriensis]|nr:serine/threonine-protein kinase TTK/MPS1 [Pseudohyphozyma bogoriensis]